MICRDDVILVATKCISGDPTVHGNDKVESVCQPNRAWGVNMGFPIACLKLLSMYSGSSTTTVHLSVTLILTIMLSATMISDLTQILNLVLCLEIKHLPQQPSSSATRPLS